MNLSLFQKLPILSILRGVEERYLNQAVQTTIDAGLNALEITLNTRNALTLIEAANNRFKGKISIGAGTVLNLQNAKDAVRSGAAFIVAPNFNAEIAAYCRNSNIPFFPGALTPSEIYAAWESGATMVKVFPAGFFGPKYFKEIKGPFDKLKLMAVGGVKPDNIAEYFKNGADAVAIGGSVYNKEWIEHGEFDKIKALISKYIESYKNLPHRS
jgi:2-dehydro-3-deoxyphosphogluconate aldolase/(4S)-4-hydroxy-2-oxoglutarate aldolase